MADTELSPERIAEIRARLNRAQCGPWKVYTTVLEKNEAGQRDFPAGFEMREHRIGTAYDHPQLKAPVPIVSTASRPYCVNTHGISIADADAEFIAHAPDDIDDLLSDRDRLLRENAELRKLIRDVPAEFRGGTADEAQHHLFACRFFASNVRAALTSGPSNAK